MNRIQQKMRSRQGASITYALLLFLVCAVLSSIIIVASTVAAGRISGLAQNDQRYYSVTSAVELLRDVLGEEPVTIVEVKEGDDTQPYNDEGEASEKPQKTETSKTYLVEGKANNLNYKDLTSQLGDTAPVNLSDGKKENLVKYFAFQYQKARMTTEFLPFNLTIAQDSSGSELSCQMNDSGALTIQVSSGGSAPYILTMHFQADIKVSQDHITVKEVKGDYNDGDNRDKGKVVEEQRQVTKTTLSWKLVDITKVE